MSEERFDRLEGQLTQLIQAVGTIQQNMGAMNQNIDALREDVIALRHRIDSVEGSQQVIMREGFQSLMSYNDDLNYELSHILHQYIFISNITIDWVPTRGTPTQSNL